MKSQIRIVKLQPFKHVSDHPLYQLSTLHPPLHIALPEASSLPPRPLALHKPVGKFNQAPISSSPRQPLHSVWTTVSSKKKANLRKPYTYLDSMMVNSTR
jgi:hypothetical protein